jgi:hypothetical protein
MASDEKLLFGMCIAAGILIPFFLVCAAIARFSGVA